MRIVLHDVLLERQLMDWLGQALQRRGHEVLVTGAVHHPQRPPRDREERAGVARAARATLQFEPDAVLAFRPFSLPLDVLDELARRGAHRMLFLGDDPVLYAVSSRDALEHYDTMLHAGFEPVLRFYEERHGPTGVTMPFWAEPTALPRGWIGPEHAEVDLVFLGSVCGPVRADRWELIDRLGVEVRVHGKLPPDDRGRNGGWLDSAAATARALPLARAGLNLPQIFSAYAGNKRDFPGLAELGHFWMPSRAIQYAAVGLPIVTVAPAGCLQTFPGAAAIDDGPHVGTRVRELLADHDQLVAMAERSHEAFLHAYTAAARAALVEQLVADPGGWRDLTLEARATLFARVAAGGGRRADAVVAPPIAAVPARAPRRASERRRVIVSGYFGARNTGDDILLETVSDAFARATPPVAVVVASLHPQRLLARGIEAFDRADLARCEAEVKRSAGVVVGPGGLWHDYSFDRGGRISGMFTAGKLSVTGLGQLPLLARILGRDVHCFGLGVGPLEDPDARAVVRFVAMQAASVTVRDEASRRLLRGIPGWAADVCCAPDPAYAWPMGRPQLPESLRDLRGGRPWLAVNVRRWEGDGIAGFHERLAAALSAISRRHRLSLVGIAMQGGAHADHAALAALFERLDTPHPTRLVAWDEDPAGLIAVLGQARATVGMRLHACLLSHRLGRPAVGLAYDPKVARHFEDLGRRRHCLALTASAATLEAAIAAVATPGAALEAGTTSAIAEREEAARASVASLVAAIAAVGVAAT